MPDAFDKTVTVDDLMVDFIADMSDADELSPSIFTSVDNYIDEMCIEVMQGETSIFENGDMDNGQLPFNYIVDKVLERIDKVEDIANVESLAALTRSLDTDSTTNHLDPDYCEEINFDEITPEDFQLYISSPESNAGNEDDSNQEQQIF